MSNLQYRLVKHFARHEPGEYVPIEFIEMTRETVAWSPRLKQSIYIIPDMPDSGSISTIELTDEEKEQFENVYKEYQEKGDKEQKRKIEVKSILLSENFEGEGG